MRWREGCEGRKVCEVDGCEGRKECEVEGGV